MELGTIMSNLLFLFRSLWLWKGTVLHQKGQDREETFYMDAKGYRLERPMINDREGHGLQINNKQH